MANIIQDIRDNKSEGNICMFCREGETSENFIKCKNIKCSFRLHLSCEQQCHQKNKKRFDCPCGSYYNEYLGPRSSFTNKVIIYAFIGVFLKLDINIISYPIKLYTSIILGSLIFHYLFGEFVVSVIFGFFILLLFLYTIAVWSLRQNTIRFWLLKIFNKYRGPIETYSIFEQLIDTSIKENK